jgi:membrane associated rhomboid family serine protease
VNSSGPPWVTFVLALAIMAGFVLELALGPDVGAFLQRWGVVPVDITTSLGLGYPVALITVLTALFLHAGWLHLGANLLYLAVFGSIVEGRLGHVRYLVLYLISGLAGGLVYTFTQPMSATPAIGASGAIAGVIGAFLVLLPGATLGSIAPVLFFRGVENAPAVLLLVLWVLTQLLSGVASIAATSAVAWWAHLGGFASGLLLAPLLRRDRRRARGLRT